jgi:hypothetical protein
MPDGTEVGSICFHGYITDLYRSPGHDGIFEHLTEIQFHSPEWSPDRRTAALDLHHQILLFISSIALRSLISMLVRCAPAPKEAIKESILAGVQKEIIALTDLWSDTEVFGGYEGLIGFFDPNYPINPDWHNSAGECVRSFILKVHDCNILYPHYSRTKNLGYDTANSFFTSHGFERDTASLTGAELLKHYHKSGEKVDGPCEMRQAFRFNDLKPRVYFCQGGTAFFTSLYMKRIALCLLESVPATKMRTRVDPITYINAVMEMDDSVIFWDLSSFTSRLSEFKFFLWYLARYVQRDPLGNKKIKLFDYHQGIIQTTLWEYLDQYREANANSPTVTCMRFFKILDGLYPEFMSVNGGLLGVPGNIGVSMFLHGMISTEAVGNKCVCVGDDAIAAVQDTAFIKETIQNLGEIPEDKFGVRTAGADYQTFKFLKRRVERLPQNGLVIDELFSFSALPEILGIPILGRSATVQTYHDRQRRLLQDVGRNLWFLLRENGFWSRTEHDLQVIRKYYQALYRKFKLPMAGALPKTHFDQELQDYVSMPVPSLEFLKYDPRLLDWAEYLYDSHPNKLISVPRLSEGNIKLPRDASKGESYVCTYSGVLRFLEEVGSVEIRTLEDTIQTTVENRRRFLNHVHGISKRLRLYKVYIRDSFPDIEYGHTLDTVLTFQMPGKLVGEL